MTNLEYGYDLDEQQRKDNENYLNKVDKKVLVDVFPWLPLTAREV